MSTVIIRNNNKINFLILSQNLNENFYFFKYIPHMNDTNPIIQLYPYIFTKIIWLKLNSYSIYTIFYYLIIENISILNGNES